MLKKIIAVLIGLAGAFLIPGCSEDAGKEEPSVKCYKASDYQCYDYQKMPQENAENLCNDFSGEKVEACPVEYRIAGVCKIDIDDNGSTYETLLYFYNGGYEGGTSPFTAENSPGICEVNNGTWSTD